MCKNDNKKVVIIVSIEIFSINLGSNFGAHELPAGLWPWVTHTDDISYHDTAIYCTGFQCAWM